MASPRDWRWPDGVYYLGQGYMHAEEIAEHSAAITRRSAAGCRAAMQDLTPVSIGRAALGIVGHAGAAAEGVVVVAAAAERLARAFACEAVLVVEQARESDVVQFSSLGQLGLRESLDENDPRAIDRRGWLGP
jgi:hypothetical protein